MKLLGVVPQNLVSAENLGRTLLTLILLVSIVVFMIVNFILSLLWLTVWTLKKSKKLLLSIGAPGSTVRYILCRWADGRKNMSLTLKRWQNFVWRKAGDSRPDSISTFSAMHGGLSPNDLREYYNEQHKKAMTASTESPEHRARKAGL